jgi:methyl-accepting chemotaxis protein
MEKVTQSNAGNAEETATAAEELNAQADQMLAAVGDLQRLVGLTATPRAEYTAQKKINPAPKQVNAAFRPHRNQLRIASSNPKNSGKAISARRQSREALFEVKA